MRVNIIIKYNTYAQYLSISIYDISNQPIEIIILLLRVVMVLFFLILYVFAFVANGNKKCKSKYH